MGTPREVKASCIRLMMGMRASIPVLPDMLAAAEGGRGGGGNGDH